MWLFSEILAVHSVYSPRKHSYPWRGTGTLLIYIYIGRLCDLVVRVPGLRSRDPVSIPGATGFSDK
jgi:hypothetical protein